MPRAFLCQAVTLVAKCFFVPVSYASCRVLFSEGGISQLAIGNWRCITLGLLAYNFLAFFRGGKVFFGFSQDSIYME